MFSIFISVERIVLLELFHECVCDDYITRYRGYQLKKDLKSTKMRLLKLLFFTHQLH